MSQISNRDIYAAPGSIGHGQTEAGHQLPAGWLGAIKATCLGDRRRLKLIASYEQLLAGVQLAYASPEARVRVGAELYHALLCELGDG